MFYILFFIGPWFVPLGVLQCRNNFHVVEFLGGHKLSGECEVFWFYFAIILLVVVKWFFGTILFLLVNKLVKVLAVWYCPCSV